jgi:RNA polymerase sigma-70 factor (ECF subfamily)
MPVADSHLSGNVVVKGEITDFTKLLEQALKPRGSPSRVGRGPHGWYNLDAPRPGGSMAAPASEITALLAAAQSGDEAETNHIVPLVYEELRRLARRHMAGQRRGHTLQTTDLVNEAYLKLINVKGAAWKDRLHFFAVASRAMRCVLVDHARRRAYAKRGGNPVRVSLSEAGQVCVPRTADVVAVDEALSRLAAVDPRKAQIVELRYFGGLSVEEIAQLLDLSSRTIKREWRWARAWLYRELGEERRG